MCSLLKNIFGQNPKKLVLYPQSLQIATITTCRPLFSCKKKKKQFEPFKDKIALITGGAMGIGFQCVRELLLKGVEGVTIADKDQVNGESALKKIAEEFGNNRAIFIKCDVMKSELIDWAVKNTLKHYNRIDIIINNAGVLNDKRWEHEVITNMGGCIVGSLLGLQYMSKSCQGEGGVVVNIASTMGVTPYCGCPIYSMTQAGILGLTRALGEGCHIDRTGVKVMAVCAGLTDTQLLADATCHALNDKFCKEFQEELESEMMQEPSVVAKAVVKAIEAGRAGSIWVSENGEDPYEIDFPSTDAMKMVSKSDDQDGCVQDESEEECPDENEEKEEQCVQNEADEIDEDKFCKKK